MKRVLAALPLVLAPVLPPICTGSSSPEPGQDPPVDPPEEEEEEEVPDPELERDIFGRLRTRDTTEGGGLRGMWQLLDLELEGYPPQGLQAVGYLLIAEDFVAFQLQAHYDELQVEDPFVDGYQTFMGEYDVLGGDRLVVRTLIGSYLDEEDAILDYEPSGITREYELERDGRLLTLTWEGANRMTFGPRRPSGIGLETIFGEERGERGSRGPDIFGKEGVKGEKEEEEEGGGR